MGDCIRGCSLASLARPPATSYDTFGIIQRLHYVPFGKDPNKTMLDGADAVETRRMMRQEGR